MRRRALRLAGVVIACGAMWCEGTAAQPFAGGDFAYGNAGYAAGSSISGVRGWRSGCGYWSGGGVCGPWWRGGCNRVGGWPDACGPGGWWFGWPGLGFGGCQGSARWGWSESIYLSVPPGGGATFFSGRQVPFVTGVVPVVGGWPMNWYPGYAVGAWGWYPYAVPAPVGVGPQFGPAGILPFLGASTGGAGGAAAVAAAARPIRAVAARPSPASRRVNEASRRRAAGLVATGDGHLRAARAGDPALARSALDAYRRAAAAAADDPDIRIREALALVALGEPHAADVALARAVAIDGRLADAAPRRGDLPPDPVFGDRPADEPAPLAARGSALLREIGGGDAAAVEWIAARWGERWAGAAAAVASR